MKNRIFKKDEKGNYIIDFANIDRNYYSLISHEDKPKLDRLSFFELSYFEEDRALYENLKENRIIDVRGLASRVKDAKKRFLSFSKEHLKKFNPELTDKETEENFSAILDEYGKAMQYKTLYTLLGKDEITDEDFLIVEEKRKMFYEITRDITKQQSFTGYNFDLIDFILKNEDYDSKIEELKSSDKSKDKNIVFHYGMYRKWFSQTEINEFRDTVLKYKEKFGLNNEQALDEMTALGDLGTVDEAIKEKNEAFELLFKRDAEYKVDLENAEKEKAAKEAKKEEEKRRREAEKKDRDARLKAERMRKEFEKYTNFEINGTYGPRERVIPIGFNFFGRDGETVTETIGEDGVKSLFDKVKEINFRRNERPAIVIFSECVKEDALRVLEDFRAQAKKNGFDERIIEGIVTEFGDELVFDKDNSRKIVSKNQVIRNLNVIREYNKEKLPDLIEQNPDRSYLTYSTEKIDKSPKSLESFDKELGMNIGCIRYVKLESENRIYGIPREKYQFRVRCIVGRFLDLKYHIDDKLLDAFKKSKKVKEYEIDKEDDEVSL